VPDRQIHPTGVVSAPGDYVIADSAELLLKNAFAKFDGSGAAGSFKPLLRIISDAGSTLIEAVSDTEIAAGESADASWFPGLASASGGASGLSGVRWAFQALPFNAHVTIPQNSTVIVAPQTATGFFTNDTGSFSQGSYSHGGHTYYGIQVDAAAGFYLTIATMQPFDPITAGVDYSVAIFNAFDPDEAGLLLLPNDRIAVAGENSAAQTLSWASLGTQDAGPLGGPMIFAASNNNGVADYSTYMQMVCLQLDSTQTTYVGA
jgi:hypothetical protein